MPLMSLQISDCLSDENRKELLTSISKIVAESIGKPEQYVMVSIGERAIMMSGKEGQAAFVDLRSIGGLSGEVNREISRKLCALLEESLEIPPDRVYINFTEFPAANWGWNGSTFG